MPVNTTVTKLSQKMSIVSKSEKSKTKKQYIPHQLRSRPFRCITLPAICVALFIAYWFVLVPLVYHGLTINCNESWVAHWRYIYWTVVTGIFLILLAIALCLWCLKPDDEHTSEEEKETHKEQDKLLEQPVKVSNLKNIENYGLSTVDEKKSISRETIEDANFNVANLQNFESKIEKTTVNLPLRKSVMAVIKENKDIKANKEKENKEMKANKEKIETKEDKEKIEVKEDKEPTDKTIQENNGNMKNKPAGSMLEEIEDMKNKPAGSMLEEIEDMKNKPAGSMLEEIDQMFPRCSIRRRPEQKKRPDTLIIHSPKYPREYAEVARHTLSERPKSTSPLTLREEFFSDMIKSANRQTLDRTKNFLENESKHSSNNYANFKKPEVTDFILKQKSETDPSSPGYFIANVAQRNSCTAEVFLQVDGGQPEEALTICYIDQDDEVFSK